MPRNNFAYQYETGLISKANSCKVLRVDGHDEKVAIIESKKQGCTLSSSRTINYRRLLSLIKQPASRDATIDYPAR